MAHPKTKRGGTKRAGHVAPNTDHATPEGVQSTLRLAREGAKMSQVELAERAGLTQNGVSRIELIGHDHIHLRTARALAAALGTTVDALFPPKGGA